jgi:hypothetical protein
MLKGKALRRALATSDASRIGGDVPLITDKTEFITPEMAQEMLKRNTNNRPINWHKVEEYADMMKRGEWKLHSQGIILDEKGDILTGQKRLWAIIYSDTPIHMRVSRGCPSDTVRLLDRGTPQTSKDLAARETKRKHSSIEVSISRGLLILQGNNKPSTDAIADIMVERSKDFAIVLHEAKGTKKTRAVIMVLAAICYATKEPKKLIEFSRALEGFAERLNKALSPTSAEQCWGRGAIFSLAMEQARKIVSE